MLYLKVLVRTLPCIHGRLASGPVHGVVGPKQEMFEATLLSRLNRHEPK